MDSVALLHKTVLESELMSLDITTPELSSTNDVSVKLWIEKRLKQLEKDDDYGVIDIRQYGREHRDG